MAVITVSTPSLFSLKNAVKDQLPSLKSSHVSEALAYALGFKTNIALVTQLTSSPAGWPAVVDEPRFFERLATLGYASLPPISFDAFIQNYGIPEYFAHYLARITAAQERSGLDNPALPRLRHKCQSAFGHYWNLGHTASITPDKRMVLREDGCGVSHSAARAGWGKVCRSMGFSVRFPGTDHSVYFYERLPLSGGRYVEYCTGLVSMPYLAATNKIEQLPEAEVIAESLGWEAIPLPQWTWYVPFSTSPNRHATTLTLYRRKERHEDTLRAWANSFKKWAIENESRLDRENNPYRDAALGEIFASPHFPLTLTSFSELREGYLAEFSKTGFEWKEGVIARGMEELFTIWTAERRL